MKLSWEHLLARQLQTQPPTRPGMTGFPAYRAISQSKGRRLSQGLHRMLPSARGLGYPGARPGGCKVKTLTRGNPYSWRANGSPMCADSMLQRRRSGYDIPSLPQGKGRRRVTDRQFRASAISSRSREAFTRPGGLFSSLGKRACVLLPDSGIGCRVGGGRRPIGEKGLLHAPQDTNRLLLCKRCPSELDLCIRRSSERMEYRSTKSSGWPW